MATKAQIKALEDKLHVAEQISNARKVALEAVLEHNNNLSTPEGVMGHELVHQCDLAIRGMREGRTPSGNRLVEVAYGTPASCDPTTETYWSM